MVRDNWEDTLYKSRSCYFCQGMISWHGGVSPRGGGTWDNIACNICGTPVCRDCGAAWYGGDEDLGIRYRICQECLPQNKSLVNDRDPKFKVDYKYCMICEKRSDKVIRKCLCGRLACPDCSKDLAGKYLCDICAEKEIAGEKICAGCGLHMYPYQAVLKNVRSHFRVCLKCKQPFCQECCSNMQRVGKAFGHVCDKCAGNEKKSGSAKKTNPEADLSMLEKAIDRIKNIFKI